MCFLFSFLEFHYICLESVKVIRYSINSLMVGLSGTSHFSQPLLLMVGGGRVGLQAHTRNKLSFLFSWNKL